MHVSWHFFNFCFAAAAVATVFDCNRYLVMSLFSSCNYTVEFILYFDVCIYLYVCELVYKSSEVTVILCCLLFFNLMLNIYFKKFDFIFGIWKKVYIFLIESINNIISYLILNNAVIYNKILVHS